MDKRKLPALSWAGPLPQLLADAKKAADRHELLGLLALLALLLATVYTR
ncbi:hypothetical protein LJ737_19750 [Hymenobacter sp. 15J16-1T3B]|nr:hypothetical protein [Hymenobacter sp. 15J16-1T3B]MCC3159486.1 hypothetical protein [Hymenobacter sp. 15J16-1T3B]